MKMRWERKDQRVNKIKIVVIPILLLLILAPTLSMGQQYIETPLPDIEIASEDMFIDSGDNILIIGSSDTAGAKSIYLLPSGNNTNPNVLLTGLGRPWSITRNGNDVYFSTNRGYYASDIKRFDINNPNGTLTTFLSLGENTIRLQSKVIFLGMMLAIFIPVTEWIIHSLWPEYHFPGPEMVFFISLILFPLSIGYSIVKHNLFDIDAIIKRTYGYVLTWD